MDYKVSVKKIKSLYRGLGWPTWFVRIRFFTAPFKALVPHIPENGFIVDLGCGYGLFSNLLARMSPQRRILGLDLDKEKIFYADRGLPNVKFQLADITKIDIQPADCILLIHVLHHLNSYGEQSVLLNACMNRLAPGGRLVICEVEPHPWWKYVLAQFADNILYPGDTIYYRFLPELLPLLKSLSSRVEYVPCHKGTPFSHIVYVCTK